MILLFDIVIWYGFMILIYDTVSYCYMISDNFYMKLICNIVVQGKILSKLKDEN